MNSTNLDRSLSFGQSPSPGTTSRLGQTLYPTDQTSPLQNSFQTSPLCNLQVHVFNQTPNDARPGKLQLCLDLYYKKWYLTVHTNQPLQPQYFVQDNISEIHLYKDLLCIVLPAARITARPLNHEKRDVFMTDFEGVFDKLIEMNSELKQCDFGGYSWVEGRHWFRKKDAEVSAEKNTGLESDKPKTTGTINGVKTSIGRHDLLTVNSFTKNGLDTSSINDSNLSDSNIFITSQDVNSSKLSNSYRHSTPDNSAIENQFLSKTGTNGLQKIFSPLDLNNNSAYSDGILSRTGDQIWCNDSNLSLTNIADITFDHKVNKTSADGFLESGLCMIRHCRRRLVSEWREGWIILKPNESESQMFVTPDLFSVTSKVASEQWKFVVSCKGEKPFTVHPLGTIACLVLESDRACLRLGKRSQIQLVPCEKSDPTFKSKIGRIVQKLENIKASSIQSGEQNSSIVPKSRIDSISEKERDETILSASSGKKKKKKKRKSADLDNDNPAKTKTKMFLQNDSLAEMAAEFGCVRLNDTTKSDVNASRDCENGATEETLSSRKKRSRTKSSQDPSSKKKQRTVFYDDLEKPKSAKKNRTGSNGKKVKRKSHVKNKDLPVGLNRWKILPTKRRLMTTRLRNQNSAVRRGVGLAGSRNSDNEEYFRLQRNLASPYIPYVGNNYGKMNSINPFRNREKFRSESPSVVVIDLTDSPQKLKDQNKATKECQNSLIGDQDGHNDTTDSDRIQTSQSLIEDSMNSSSVIYLSDSNSVSCNSDADSGMADSASASQTSPGDVINVKLDVTSERQKLVRDFVNQAEAGEMSTDNVIIVKRKNKVTQTSDDDVINDVTQHNDVTRNHLSDGPEMTEDEEFFSADEDGDVSSAGSSATSLHIVTSDEDMTLRRHVTSDEEKLAIDNILDKMLDITTDMEQENTTTQNTIDEIRTKIANSQASSPLLKPGQFPDFFVTPQSSLGSESPLNVPNSPIINRISPVLNSPVIISESPLPLTPVRVTPARPSNRVVANTANDSSRDSFPVEPPIDDLVVSSSSYPIPSLNLMPPATNLVPSRISSASNLVPPRPRHESTASSVSSFNSTPQKSSAQVLPNEDTEVTSAFNSQVSQTSANFHHEFEKFIIDFANANTSGQVSDSNLSQTSEIAKSQTNNCSSEMEILNSGDEDDLDLKMTSESEGQCHSSEESPSDVPKKKPCYVKKASVSVFFIADAKFKFGEIGRKHWIKSALLKQEAMMWLQKRQAMNSK